MNCQPDCFTPGACIDNPVLCMRGYSYVISLTEPDNGFVLEGYTRITLQQYHPFIPLLVVPSAFRRTLPRGYDSLDFHMTRLRQHLEHLMTEVGRYQIINIVLFHRVE